MAYYTLTTRGWRLIKRRKKAMGDVWVLETPDEERTAQDLDGIAICAQAGQQWAIAYLQELWGGESWVSIQNKLNSEGSAWYVWWMDGVRKLLARANQEG